VGTTPQRCEYVLVLGGGEETRPFAAAALVKAGFAHKVLVPRARTSPQEHPSVMPPMHEVIRRVLRHRGVAEADIVVLDQPVSHTFDEAASLAAFLKSRPAAAVIVVTNDFHSRRARWIFRHVLQDRARQLCFVSVPNEQFLAAHWWQTEQGFIPVVGEYLKLAFYTLRYAPLQVAALAGMTLLAVALMLSCRQRFLCRKALSPS
jgi:uncharacterized SAM-binding protein YcdF (DUF218 family)